ncbi:MAG TPA: hypothetical protein VF260_02920 [Bacilli bacterium]
MRKGERIFIWILIALFTIGLFSSLLRSTTTLIAIFVFGTVFLLWKFPPNTWRPRITRGRKGAGKKQKIRVKNARFRVISGNKKDGDEDKPPRFH